jgi:hypothetical protein
VKAFARSVREAQVDTGKSVPVRTFATDGAVDTPPPSTSARTDYTSTNATSFVCKQKLLPTDFRSGPSLNKSIHSPRLRLQNVLVGLAG